MVLGVVAIVPILFPPARFRRRAVQGLSTGTVRSSRMSVPVSQGLSARAPILARTRGLEKSQVRLVAITAVTAMPSDFL